VHLLGVFEQMFFTDAFLLFEWTLVGPNKIVLATAETDLIEITEFFFYIV